MKTVRLYFTVLLFSPLLLVAQEETNETLWEQKVESVGDLDQEESSSVEALKAIWEETRQHPFSLNQVTREELASLELLTEIQVFSFFEYRRLLGRFLSIYELQAIPSWSVEIIRKILPYLTLEEPFRLNGNVISSMMKGTHNLLIRTGGGLETLRYSHWRTLPGELGNPLKTMLRYRFSSSPFLDIGFTGEKDAGEALVTRQGFDFNSLHLFIRKWGKIKSLALGDYTVSMGQGLIQWQGMAFHKSVAISQIKRQGPVLTPYRSAGEYGFQRGVGVTMTLNRWETTFFASRHFHDARIEVDSAQGLSWVRSFLNTGYHTNEKEVVNKHNLSETTAGAVIKFKGEKGGIALNAIGYRFSTNILKEEAPYRLFSFKGNYWGGLSVDYSVNWKAIHGFGEMAFDPNLQKAFLAGLLVAPDPKVDLTLLARYMDEGYQSLKGNAFTESSLPGNERGIFVGMSIRPAYRWELNLYMDLYRFPWLKYRVDGPSEGKDFLLQLSYKPSKNIEIYGRFRYEAKQVNSSSDHGTFHDLMTTVKRQGRLHLDHKPEKSRENRARVELLWLRSPGELELKKGYLAYLESHYKSQNRWSFTGRIQFFESDGYETRIYAFENDLPYGYAVPSFYDKGFKGYLTLHRDFSLPSNLKPLKKLQCWAKYGKMVKKYPARRGNTSVEEWLVASTDFKLQFMLHW